MANEQKKKHPTERPAAPEVVYTQPSPINRKKLIFRLVTAAAVILSIFIGFSIFFRVDTIVVSGNQQYSAEMIREASGIELGDSLLGFGKTKACGKIAEFLPYVMSVRIGIKLPGTVTIYISEVKVTYSVQDKGGEWWLLASDGRIMERVGANEAAKHTQIIGLTLENPQISAKAKPYEPEPEDDKPVTLTAQDRLDAVLRIAVRLERNGILGDVTSIDVTDMGNIVLEYAEQYTVLLGDFNHLDYKVDTMKGAIETHDSHQKGKLEIIYGIPPVKDGEEPEYEDEIWYAKYTPAK